MQLTILDENLKKYGTWKFQKFPMYFPRQNLKMVCLVNWSELGKMMHHPDVRYFSIRPNITVNGEKLFAVGFEKQAGISRFKVKLKYLNK